MGRDVLFQFHATGSKSWNSVRPGKKTMPTAYTILNIPLWFTLVPENLLRYPTLALDVSLRMLEEQVSFEPNEIILGDKGYQGHPLSAIKNTSSYRVDYCDKAFNESPRFCQVAFHLNSRVLIFTNHTSWSSVLLKG